MACLCVFVWLVIFSFVIVVALPSFSSWKLSCVLGLSYISVLCHCIRMKVSLLLELVVGLDLRTGRSCTSVTNTIAERTHCSSMLLSFY